MSVHFIKSDLHLAVNSIKTPYGKFIQRQKLGFSAVFLAEPAGKEKTSPYSYLYPGCSNLHASVAYCALAGELTGFLPEPIQITEIRKSAQEKNNRPNEPKKCPNSASDIKPEEKRNRADKESKRRKILKSV